MSGNSTTCQAPIDRQDKEAILALDPESMRGYVQFDDLDAAGEELVLRAWAFLRANEDLIRWAFCWVQGDATNAERVIRKLHGTDANTGFFQSRVQFSVKGAGQGNCSSQGEVDAQDYTYAYGTPTVWGGSIVFCNYVFDGQETWDTFVSNWSAENDYSRACQVIHLAGRLLHELGHAVEAVEPDPNGFDACHDSYIVENTFVYGALTRFPDAAAEYCSSVCSVSKNEVSLLFGSDGLGGSYYDDGRAALPDLEVAGCGEVNP